MKSASLYSIILMLTISTLQLHAMEAQQQLLLSQQRHYQALSKKNNPYKNQVLPDDAWDKIIAYSSHDARKNLKETCTQLAYLTSINRLNKFIIHDFMIGDEKEKAAFFKALIKTNDPQLITPFMAYTKKEGELYYFRNAINEDDPAYHTPEQYIQGVYLQPLLEEATNQESVIMIDRLKTENIDENILDQYDTKLKKRNCGRILVATVASLILLITGGIVGGMVGYVEWFNNYCTKSCFSDTCTMPCNRECCCMSINNGPWQPC